MESNARYWDKAADSYFARPIKDVEGYQAKLRVTQDYLKPHMNILEFGCGSGGTALAHAPFVKSVQAIDISGRMIEIANRQAREQSVENVTFQHRSFDEFKAEPETFDVILALSVLHLVNDRDATIAKVSTMLKPGGFFVSSTDCLGEAMGALKWILPIGEKLGFMPTLRVFSSKQLGESLHQQGLSILHQEKPERDTSVFIIAQK